MKNGLVIADSGAIFSLAVFDQLNLLELLFDRINIPKAVWEEITRVKNSPNHQKIKNFFKFRVKEISRLNDLILITDYGESESILLCREMNADFLLIDDKKARKLAENFWIKCLGCLGLLSTAKSKGLIKNLRPLFYNSFRE